MIEFRNQERVEGQVGFGESSFELVSTETTLGVGQGRYGFSISYRRPTRIGAEPPGSGIPIRDHVMIVRLIALALSLLSLVRRSTNGR